MSQNLPLEVYKSFENNTKAINLLEELSKILTELFNYFEPAYFKGKFYILNCIENEFILPEENSQMITFNKEILLHQDKDFVIQLMDDNLYFWDDFDETIIKEKEQILAYYYNDNREYFLSNKNEIDITEQSFGSKFSSEFCELKKYLKDYAISKIRQSTCPLFNDNSWHDDCRIFFKGGGKDIPEKFMQSSLKNFIDDIRIFKGEIGQFEGDREHNLGSERPVDLLVKWEKSNRIALIEIKWLGKSKKDDNKITTTYTNSRANEGYKQLKDYYELAKKDYPTKIIKCYLVVIDGRRWNTNENTTSISYENGMYYVNKDLQIDEDKKYWSTFFHFEKPIRMFVEPVCEM